ncbi:MAG: hypothetical protein IJZ77_02975 [Bacilli bacterium]|nr:hypothetical protein [Bacilli bacterium]
MAYKNYVKDESCRIFDTYTKIKQCWAYLSKLYDEGKAIPFTERQNEFGAKDIYVAVKMENATYIISMGSNGGIRRIVRF